MALLLKYFFTGYNPPHFQALYDDTLGIFKIDTLEMVEGDLTDIAQSLVKEWAEKYKTDLMEMWNSKTLKTSTFRITKRDIKYVK